MAIRNQGRKKIFSKALSKKQTLRSGQKGRSVPGTGAEIPLQLVVQPMVRQDVTPQPLKVGRNSEIHLQLMNDPTLEQVEA